MSMDTPTADPTVVVVLTALYNRDGKLTAESVLHEASNPDSPLHDRLEWDDTLAAHEYRLEQCRAICRSVTISVEQREVRAFPFVTSAGTYAPIGEAMRRKDWRDEIVAEFHRDAARFEARWANHSAVAEHYRQWRRKTTAA